MGEGTALSFVRLGDFLEGLKKVSGGGSFWWSIVQKILRNVLPPLSIHLVGGGSQGFTVS